MVDALWQMSDVVSGSLGWRNVVVLQKKHRTQNVNVRKHFEVECALLSKNESFYRRKCKKYTIFISNFFIFNKIK